MPASTKGRTFHTQQKHYLRRRFTVTDFSGSAVQVKIGTIPAGSIIPDGETRVVLTTAFGSGGNVQLGSSGDPDFLFSSRITASTAASQLTGGISGLMPLSADLDVYAMISADLTGLTMPATGVFEAVIEYIPNNDSLNATTQFDS